MVMSTMTNLKKYKDFEQSIKQKKLIGTQSKIFKFERLKT